MKTHRKHDHSRWKSAETPDDETALAAQIKADFPIKASLRRVSPEV
jgi:hypothetical protein